MLNCLAYAETPDGERIVDSPKGLAFLRNQTTPSYLSQIVFRL
jgi:hypothetical protein